MTKHYKRLIAKAEIQLQDEYNKWMNIIFPSAITTLWQKYGWRYKRIYRLIERMQDVYKECSVDPDMSILKMLDNEVGLDLRIVDEKSWKDYCVLNSDLRRKRLPAEILHMKKKETEWAHASILSIVLLGLYRKERWGMRSRIPAFEIALYETCVTYQYNSDALLMQVQEYMGKTLSELLKETDKT